METVKLEVGQKLWWVNTISSWGCWVEVTEIGQAYAHISRIDTQIRLTDLVAVRGSNGWQEGRCYVDKEAYEARKVVQEKWDEMRFNMRFNSLPDDVTVEQVEAAMRLLGL